MLWHQMSHQNVYLLVTDPRIYWELTEYKENLDKHGIGDKPVIPALGGSKAETLRVQGHPQLYKQSKAILAETWSQKIRIQKIDK